MQALTLSRQRLLGMALIAGSAVLLLVAGLLYWRISGQAQQAQISASRDELAQMHTSCFDSSAALERVAHNDALTGLGNRHA